MGIQAGFAEVDITPEPGTHKIGWLRVVVGERIVDPLFARAAVFDDGHRKIGFIQLDLLCIRWTQVSHIRERICTEIGFPGQAVMVAATHNHAGPAVASVGDVVRDEEYVAQLEDRCVAVFADALRDLADGDVGLSQAVEPGLAFNRRMIMRDGTVKSQVPISPEALCPEGPADPELGVLAFRAKADRVVKGCIVNFTCHPLHHGGENVFSAGYPGVLAARMKSRGCPVTLFLNGASGNIISWNPLEPSVMHSKESLGGRLADRVTLMLAEMPWRAHGLALGSASRTIDVPYRNPTEAEVRGTVRGAQRYIDPAIYDRGMPALCEKIRVRGGRTPAEVQALCMGDYAWVGIPAEYFVEHGIRIKEETGPRRTWVVGHANGMLGYLPTRQALERGGYETTFGGSSRMAPEAGTLLADTAIDLIRTMSDESVVGRCSG